MRVSGHFWYNLEQSFYQLSSGNSSNGTVMNCWNFASLCSPSTLACSLSLFIHARISSHCFWFARAADCVFLCLHRHFLPGFRLINSGIFWRVYLSTPRFIYLQRQSFFTSYTNIFTNCLTFFALYSPLMVPISRSVPFRLFMWRFTVFTLVVIEVCTWYHASYFIIHKDHEASLAALSSSMRSPTQNWAAHRNF